jgi:hypothetical protein
LLLCLEGCNPCTLFLLGRLLGLQDGCLLLLLHGSERLLLRLFLQENLTATDGPATCHLSGLLSECKPLQVSGSAHLCSLELSAQGALFSFCEPELTPALSFAQLAQLSLLLGGQLGCTGSAYLPNALGDSCTCSSYTQPKQSECDGVCHGSPQR